MITLALYQDEWANYYTDDDDIKALLKRYFFFFIVVGLEDVFLLYLNAILKCLN